MRLRLSVVLIVLSLALNALMAIRAIAVVANMGGWPWLRREVAEVFPALRSREPGGCYADTRISQFEQLPIGPGDIVLLGDSIFDYGEWHELLGTDRAKNRAINGDQTHQILLRLRQILPGRPRHVVLLIGINNLQTGMPYEQTVREYTRIVSLLTPVSCSTELWILPVIPINTRLFMKCFPPDNPQAHVPQASDVALINAFIRRLIAGRPRIHLVEMPELLDPAGEMRAEYTLDGIHLNGAGLGCVAMRLRRELPGLYAPRPGSEAMLVRNTR